MGVLVSGKTRRLGLGLGFNFRKGVGKSTQFVKLAFCI